MSLDVDNVIGALRSGNDSLAGLVRGLSDKDLARASGCAEWDVSQVLSHLGSASEINYGTMVAAAEGKPGPGRDSWPAIWDRWNAMSRRDRATEFLLASEATVALWESLDAGAKETMRIDTGFLPAPIDAATMARMRLNEYTLHSWDVQVAFDEHATLARDAVGQLLNKGFNMLSLLGKPERLDGLRAVLRVTTSDPASVFALRLDDPVSVSSTGPASEGPDRPDGTLALPAEAWLRLISGRLSPQHTPVSVEWSGPVDLDLLRRVFPGY